MSVGHKATVSNISGMAVRYDLLKCKRLCGLVLVPEVRNVTNCVSLCSDYKLREQIKRQIELICEIFEG